MIDLIKGASYNYFEWTITFINKEEYDDNYYNRYEFYCKDFPTKAKYFSLSLDMLDVIKSTKETQVKIDIREWLNNV